MNYLLFRQKMLGFVCFNTNQIFEIFPRFNRNNLTRWIKKGLLIRLRQGLYTFSEYRVYSDYILYFANKIYNPSYISLHTALSFYGIIPEAVLQITSVTSLKTASFNNEFGDYKYKSVKDELIFGYDLKIFFGERVLKIAKAEKAILDLLYLYPFYNTEKELLELRLDEDFLHYDFDIKLFHEYSVRFRNLALEKRKKRLLKAYGL